MYLDLGSAEIVVGAAVSRVFISYATEDRDLADEIKRWLDAERHSVFLDKDPRDGIAPGDEWEPRLYEQLRGADAVVCVVTSAYQASVWCTAEVACARQRGSRLVPLHVEAGVAHPLLRSIQHIDYAHDPAAARLALRELLRRIDKRGGYGWPDDRNPFPGLIYFDTDMHRAFFGRREEVEALSGLIRSQTVSPRHSLVLVVGPSGCGKSSLVRAGLLPVIGDEADWLALPAFFPGRDPLSALARELAIAGRQWQLGWNHVEVRERLTAGEMGILADELLVAASNHQPRHHLLVVVDQLEELLTQVDAAGRAGFAEALRPALAGSVHVVATMRPESLPGLLTSQELAGLPLEPFTLRTLRPEALPEVIRGPTELAGIGIDDGLVQSLVADTATGEALPLLAFVLSKLAAGIRRGETLPTERYRELGGVHGALQRQADAALHAACAARGRHRRDVLSGLLRLVTVDEWGAPTRLRVRHDELPEPVLAELDVFIANRLLTTDTDENGEIVIGVAHEAILAAWAPLKEAIDAAASGLRARRALSHAADGWYERAQPSDGLWEHNQITAAMDATGARVQWREGGDRPWHRLLRLALGGRTLVTDRVELDPRASEFLMSSYRRDRSQRALRQRIFAVLLAGALATAGIAADQCQQVSDQQRIATARLLVSEAEALRDTQPRISLLLSAEASHLDPSSGARESLLTTLTQSRLAATLTGHSRAVNGAAYSPDGRILVTGSTDGTVILWDLTRRSYPARLTTLTQTRAVTAVAYAPVGHVLATGSADGSVTIWDITDSAHPARLVNLTGHTGIIKAVGFSRDGHTLASGSADGKAILWDLTNRLYPRLASIAGHTKEVDAVAFSPDGHTLATGSLDDTAILWDVSDRVHPTRVATLSGHSSYVTAVAFSPDGRSIVTGSLDSTAILWDLSDRTHPARLAALTDHTEPVDALAFSRDGHKLATGSWDGTAILWDMTDRTHPTHLDTLGGSGTGYGFVGDVSSVAYSPDGHTLAVGSEYGTVFLWDLANRGHLARLATLGTIAEGSSIFEKALDALALSPDGRTLATGSADGTVVLWDIADRVHPAELATLSGHSRTVRAAAFGPSGAILATGSEDGTAILWDLTDHAHPARQATLRNPDTGPTSVPITVTAVAFAPDGRALATGSPSGRVFLWDLTDPARPSRLAALDGQGNIVEAVAYGPRALAVGGDDDTTTLWDVTDRERPSQLNTLGGFAQPVGAVAFSPDGRNLVTGTWDGTATLWNLTDRTHPVRLATLTTITGHTGSVHTAAFGPNGGTLATGSSDGTASLWDLTDRAHPVHLATLAGHKGPVLALAYSRDGNTLATASGDGTAIVWDLTGITDVARDPVAVACAIAGPALSREDWVRYVPGMPYAQTCP